MRLGENGDCVISVYCETENLTECVNDMERVKDIVDKHAP